MTEIETTPVFVLCGGLGTRLREETQVRPKPMVPVGDSPILLHVMRWYAHHGFRRFVLCVGYKSEVIKSYFLGYSSLHSDFTVNLKKAASVEEINAAFEAASKKALKGVLKYTEDPIVSSDIVTDPHSCVFDAGLTMSMGKLVKINGWYDNEWGYSNRLVDLTAFTGSKVKR